MTMPGRSYTNGNQYRYGFNGKEKDKDITEAAQDYGMRIYDSRLVHFLSIDPLTKNFPELTPYQYASNSPIENIDLDGLESISAIRDANARKFSTATKLALAQPKPREIEIMAWNPYLGQAQIGRASDVKEIISISRNNYNSAIASNISNGPFGAFGYMVGGDKGSFIGAAGDGVVLSFGGFGGRSSVLSRPQNSFIERSLSVTEPKPVDQKSIGLTINLKQGWNSKQIREAYEKAYLITTEGVNTEVNRENTKTRPPNVKKLFTDNGGTVGKNQDVDHTQDLILNGNNGADGTTNLSGRDKSVNRSFGKQFEIQTRNVPDGTRISGVYVNPFGKLKP